MMPSSKLRLIVYCNRFRERMKEIAYLPLNTVLQSNPPSSKARRKNNFGLDLTLRTTSDQNIMSTTGYFSSWWSGTKIVDSDEGIQTPKASESRHPKTRSQNSREAKKRKTMDGVSVADLFSGDKSMSLEDIAANLQTYLLHSEERQKKYEEQARRAEARTQRIESMLKRVLENQKKILEADVEAESNEEEEQEEITPSRRTKSRAWSTKESELVSMAVRLYGRDMKAIQNILEDRNRDQIRGFLRRNVRRLSEDLKSFPIRDESEKEALLEAIKRRQEEETEDEEEEEDDDDDDDDDDEVDEDEEGESEGDATRSKAGTRWTDEERQRLLEGIKIHGKEDIDVLAAFVQTRSPKQTRMYIYRQLRV